MWGMGRRGPEPSLINLEVSMATAEVVKDEYSELVELEHAHEHEHEPFIAHHFHTAEQQFDSGKLGIWLFLVTEVLFFGGLFVAYILYRYNNPDVFTDAHTHLDTLLGGLNTVVLLFSSLTMAWGVRAAQLGDNKTAAISVLITMVCAALFLGVKAVEYSHKWDVGLLPGDYFSYVPGAHHEHHMISPYLVMLSIPFGLLLLVFAGASALYLNTGKRLLGQFMGGMAITMLGYFLGVVVGVVWMEVAAGSKDDHGSHHAAVEITAPVLAEAGLGETVAGGSMRQVSWIEDDPAPKVAGDPEAAADSATEAPQDPASAASDPAAGKPVDKSLGIFFSIYYCMTGLHAIHILGGIVALGWIFYRSLALHWRPDYFGPVDFVGLYWHLVDLIWIYLFPLMYLIR